MPVTEDAEPVGAAREEGDEGKDGGDEALDARMERDRSARSREMNSTSGTVALLSAAAAALVFSAAEPSAKADHEVSAQFSYPNLTAPFKPRPGFRTELLYNYEFRLGPVGIGLGPRGSWTFQGDIPLGDLQRNFTTHDFSLGANAGVRLHLPEDVMLEADALGEVGAGVIDKGMPPRFHTAELFEGSVTKGFIHDALRFRVFVQAGQSDGRDEVNVGLGAGVHL